jgi:hypothetical protein
VRFAWCSALLISAVGCGAEGLDMSDADDVAENDAADALTIDVSDPATALDAQQAAELRADLAEPQAEGEIGQVQQALSASSCDSVSAHVSFDGRIIPEHISPRSYNKCTKAYVVDLDDIDSVVTGPGGGGGSDAYIEIRHADSATNRSTCEATSLRAIVYTRKLSNGNWDDSNGVYDASKNGTWRTILSYSYCDLGINVRGMTAGRDYRFAMTSRLSGNTRKVGIETHAPVVIR